MEDLIKLAKTGNYSPLEFLVAARYAPGYDVAKAVHLENQYFDSDGKPISNEEHKEE